MGQHVYPARIRRTGIYLTGLLIVAPIFGSIAFLGISQPFPAVVLVATLFVVIIVYALAFKVRYELDDHELRFRQGVFSAWRVPLEGITRVCPATGRASFSVEQIDCLLVEAGRHSHLVAVPDLDRFLAELSVRAPHLRRDGNELRGNP